MSAPAVSPLFDHGIGAFTPEELDRLERYCDALPLQKAPLGGHATTERYEQIRKTQVSPIPQTPDIIWLYERLADIVRTFNSRSYQFELKGFSEVPQFMVYHHTEESHFDWHIDQGTLPPRKLSLTLQLTDPARYEGGELQFNGGAISSAPKNRGVANAFPSYVLHRVTPVTKGTRKAIVAWISGPNFK